MTDASAAFWESGLILRTLSGSRAHGLAREGSDTDTRGVCIPPARYLLGLGEFEQHESEGGDHVIYGLAKFVRLALQGNPNLLESLFADPADVLAITPAGESLIAARDAFLSKQVGRRFMGYAHGQLQRMERHHRWLVDPPTAQPNPLDFGASEVGGRHRFPNEDQRRAYDAERKHWNHFRRWRQERHPQRAALEEQHGYDTKHAMHLVRLLKMGQEVLDEGTLFVRRPDADWLLGIRDGALSYPELLALADEMTEGLEERMERSALPDEPDVARAEALLVELHLAALNGDA